MQEVPFQPSSSQDTAPAAQPQAPSMPAGAPPQQPSSPSWQSAAAPETPKSGKGLLIGLIILVVLAVIGVGVYWRFFRTSPGKGLASNPQEMFVNGIEELVMANDAQAAWEMKPWNLLDIIFYNDSFGKKEMAEYIDPSDTMVRLNSVGVQKGLTAEGEVGMELKSPTAGTDIGLQMRSVDNKVYLQLTSLALKKLPVDFSPILNTWVLMDMKELLANSIFAMGLGEDERMMLESNPFLSIQPDRTKYFAIFKEAYMQHTPLQMEVLKDKSTATATVVSVRGDVEKGKAFALAFLPKASVQLLADIDAAIARETKAGNTAVVDSLKKFREEYVNEVGEDGEKLRKQMEDEFNTSDKMPYPIEDSAEQEGGKGDYLLEESSISLSKPLPVEFAMAPSPQYDTTTAEFTYDNKTGRFAGITVFLTYDMPAKDKKTEKKTIVLIKGSFTKYNSGVTIAAPEKFKTIKEMLPLLIGTFATATMYSPEYAAPAATSTPGALMGPEGLLPVEKVDDTDGDGASDTLEAQWQTNPLDKDTDGDGFDDYSEVKNGFNPVGPGKIPAEKQAQFAM